MVNALTKDIAVFAFEHYQQAAWQDFCEKSCQPGALLRHGLRSWSCCWCWAPRSGQGVLLKAVPGFIPYAAAERNPMSQGQDFPSAERWHAMPC